MKLKKRKVNVCKISTNLVMVLISDFNKLRKGDFMKSDDDIYDNPWENSKRTDWEFKKTPISSGITKKPLVIEQEMFPDYARDEFKKIFSNVADSIQNDPNFNAKMIDDTANHIANISRDNIKSEQDVNELASKLTETTNTVLLDSENTKNVDKTTLQKIKDVFTKIINQITNKLRKTLPKDKSHSGPSMSL